MISEQKQETDLTQPSRKAEGNTDKVAGKIAGAILRAQGWCAERMNRFRYLKLLLICFCVSSALISGYLLVDAIVSKPKAKQKIKIDRINSPRSQYEPSEELYDEKIPDEIYFNIQEYKRYMDSAGEVIRPGLADSMRVLEEMYLQQQKK